jgi:predicted ATPase/class 3 adenylate cyclase
MRPTGTVTFLFSDIEGSTRHLADLGSERYSAVLEQHRALLRDAFGRHAGHDFGGAGDSMFVAFGSAQEALRAAFDAQVGLAEHAWPDAHPVRVRIGLHTAEATSVADDYVGIGVHRASRICDAGHGGQILLSHTTHALVAESPEFAVRDLGEHELKGLPEAQRLYQLLHPRLQADFPALRTAGKRPPNLPAQATPTIGREQDVRTLCATLREPRVHLLTLTGPGGTGKTRLAVQVAAEIAEAFPHGTFFVSLASITDPALVLQAIAQALGVSAAAGQSLTAYLAEKTMLIVIDNLEQVITVAPELAALAAHAPRVKLLVTSREPLHVTGEQVYPVPPLAVPESRHSLPLESLGRCPSVALFVERAQAVQPTFALTGENAHAVAEICRHLDGLPLAIELAAARSNLLSPDAMVRRLPQPLKMLAGGARDLPLRQQTIRNAIAWSYDLLDDAERELFAQLGVFPGDFAIESAELVCATSLDVIASLVDKSLVQRRGERLAMLETIRAFAAEKLATSAFADDIGDRHAAHFETLVAEATAQRAQDEQRALDRLETDHDNLRAALDWLRSNAPARFVVVAGALAGFWHLHSHFAEGRAYLADALAMTPDPDETRARLLSAVGELAAWSGDLPSARTSIDEAIAIWREARRDREISASLLDLGWACFNGGDDAAARASMEESLRIAQRVGERALINRARIGLLQTLVAVGELDNVEAMARDALAEAERQHDVRSEHFAHHFLADCPLIAGDATSALPRYRRALELAHALGERTETAIEIQGVAMAAAGLGDAKRALMLGGAAAAELDRLGIDFSGIRFWSALLDRYYGRARAALGADDADAAWQAGRRMDFDRAVAEALAT